jgi:hypothetical protein
LFFKQEDVMAFDLGNLLNQYLGGASGADKTRAEEDFDRVSQAAPREAVAQGVTQALRSDQTPPFPQMVGQMFGQSNPNQQAGMLNQLIAAAGPSLLAMLASRGGAGVGGMGGMGGGLGGLGGMLGNLLGGAGAGQPQITPEQASQLSPEQVQEIAQKAEQENPGVVERMGDFYAQHPNVVKGLGGAALAIALAHMAQGIQRR